MAGTLYSQGKSRENPAPERIGWLQNLATRGWGRWTGPRLSSALRQALKKGTLLHDSWNEVPFFGPGYPHGLPARVHASEANSHSAELTQHADQEAAAAAYGTAG